MSQLLAVNTGYGVILAADRRVEVRQGHHTHEEERVKLYPMGTLAAIATSGAAVCIPMTEQLSKFIGDKPLSFEHAAPYVVEQMQREYDKFIDMAGDWFLKNPKAYKLSYLLIGGVNAGGEPSFEFYASEAHGEAYHKLPTQDVFTAPRRMGLETRLMAANARGAPLEEILEIIKDGLFLVAKKEIAVGGVFDLVIINSGGITRHKIG
ncbi:MAG: hypothetical protein C0608_10155 [Deltaproteobacteria bacterium]|nr:MAG: hypothetical protein C0608_10155 [Deltaproteobacteria bacterium]